MAQRTHMTYISKFYRECSFQFFLAQFAQGA